MDKTIFAFTLWTKERLEKGNCIFTETGDLVGRILSKCPTFTDDYDEFDYKDSYSYDIETTEEQYEKIANGEIKLAIKDYSVHQSNTRWTISHS